MLHILTDALLVVVRMDQRYRRDIKDRRNAPQMPSQWPEWKVPPHWLR